jgi:hypothetical protein
MYAAVAASPDAEGVADEGCWTEEHAVRRRTEASEIDLIR